MKLRSGESSSTTASASNSRTGVSNASPAQSRPASRAASRSNSGTNVTNASPRQSRQASRAASTEDVDVIVPEAMDVDVSAENLLPRGQDMEVAEDVDTDDDAESSPPRGRRVRG